MEGWYFKVAIDDSTCVGRGGKTGSFAFMYSIEDPDCLSPTSGIGAQVMGPQDSYMVQYVTNSLSPRDHNLSSLSLFQSQWHSWESQILGEKTQ